MYVGPTHGSASNTSKAMNFIVCSANCQKRQVFRFPILALKGLSDAALKTLLEQERLSHWDVLLSDEEAGGSCSGDGKAGGERRGKTELVPGWNE